MIKKIYGETFEELITQGIPLELLVHPNLIYLQRNNDNIITLTLFFFHNYGKDVDEKLFMEFSGVSKASVNKTFALAIKNRLIVKENDIFEINPRFFGFKEGVELNKFFYDHNGKKLIPTENITKFLLDLIKRG